MHPLHLAATNKQHFIRSNLYAVRLDDANRYADRPASTFSRPGLYKVQGGTAGRGIEGPRKNMGYLQCRRAAVSLTVVHRPRL